MSEKINLSEDVFEVVKNRMSNNPLGEEEILKMIMVLLASGGEVTVTVDGKKRKLVIRDGDFTII